MLVADVVAVFLGFFSLTIITVFSPVGSFRGPAGLREQAGAEWVEDGMSEGVDLEAAFEGGGFCKAREGRQTEAKGERSGVGESGCAQTWEEARTLRRIGLRRAEPSGLTWLWIQTSHPGHKMLALEQIASPLQLLISSPIKGK